MILIYFQQYVTIPFDLCKHQLAEVPSLKPTPLWKWYRNSLDISCCIDLVLNFFTGYYNFKEKEVVIDPKLVA